MRVDLFDFDLPEDRIALRPAAPREAAKLLHVPAGDAPFADRRIADLPGLLRPGDAVVVNDTRVLPARLSGVRARGDTQARIEATLHRREAPDRWRAFLRPAKRVDVGERIRFARGGADGADQPCLLDTLDASVVEKGEGGEAVLAFDLAGPLLEEALARVGTMPLPPYIAARRGPDAADAADYQTMFAAEPGAVAAPTAGLHFSPALVGEIRARGAHLHTLTLHVGAGTFLPVKADDTDAHRMHAETGTLSAGTAETLNTARAAGGRIVAVGTTSLRLLESAARPDGRFAAFAGETAIFITPGYRFRAADALLTNFHLPRSTLFMLVAAFAGLERMRAAYAHAVRTGYRFYSYGDACFLERGGV